MAMVQFCRLDGNNIVIVQQFYYVNCMLALETREQVSLQTAKQQCMFVCTMHPPCPGDRASTEFLVLINFTRLSNHTCSLKCRRSFIAIKQTKQKEVGVEGSGLMTVLTVVPAAHKVIAAAIQPLQAPETLLGLVLLSCRSS